MREQDSRPGALEESTPVCKRKGSDFKGKEQVVFVELFPYPFSETQSY